MDNNQDVKNLNFIFLKSALTKDGANINKDNIIKWLKEQNDSVNVNIKKIPFKDLTQWKFDETSGNLEHTTGRFFSIDGINVKTNLGDTAEWEQPIINQPEIGYLGFITKEINGILHFLVQAKIEPGNVNYIQLSPTLQATRSNYEQAHKGNKPLYLEYFQNATSEQILLDQLQSEQGARFLKKRNRNIIIKIDEDLPIYDNFTWLTLAQLKELMQLDNLINMDLRTVISGLPFGSFETEIIEFFSFLNKRGPYKKAFLKSALSVDNSLHTIEEIITFMTQLKSTSDLNIEKIPLRNMKNWVATNIEIHHEENKYFKVIAVEVEIGNREVVKWSQPMIESAQEGLCAFVCKEINGVLHFAVQAKLECGNHDIIELAPTVQTLTGDYRETKENTLPFLDYVLNAPREKIYFDTLQSEEGGRFYKEQNRNIIVIAGDEISIDLPKNYIWITQNQLYTFLKFNNYLNIQARSLIAAISFV